MTNGIPFYSSFTENALELGGCTLCSMCITHVAECPFLPFPPILLSPPYLPPSPPIPSLLRSFVDSHADNLRNIAADFVGHLMYHHVAIVALILGYNWSLIYCLLFVVESN